MISAPFLFHAHKSTDGFTTAVQHAAESVVTSLAWHSFDLVDTLLLGNCSNIPTEKSSLRQTMASVRGAIFGRTRQGNYLLISDWFGSQPIYIYQAKNDIAVFSHFDYFIKEVQPTLSVDETGFWQSVLLDGTLAERTIFNEVSQVEPGTIVTINLDAWNVRCSQYFDFSFESVAVASEHEVARRMIDALSCAIEGIPNADSYLLPLSGGIDSRILAAILVNVKPVAAIHSVTYAFSRLSLENVYAQNVCEVTGIEDHRFHQLTPMSYINALPAFAVQNAGSLSIAHSHLYSYLSSCDDGWDGWGLVSGFFADAVGGYAALEPAVSEAAIGETSYYLRLREWTHRLSEPAPTWFDETIADIESLFMRWRYNSTLTSFHEYTYMTQRQQKLLFPLSALYSRFLPVYMPFLDPNVVELLMGLEPAWRESKHCSRSVIKYLPAGKQLEEIGKLSSTRITDTKRSQIDNGLHKSLNYLTLALQVLSSGRLSVINPYQTETQGEQLRRQHGDLLHASVNRLHEIGLVSSSVAREFKKKHYRSEWFGPQYRLITTANALEYWYCQGNILL